MTTTKKPRVHLVCKQAAAFKEFMDKEQRKRAVALAKADAIAEEKHRKMRIAQEKENIKQRMALPRTHKGDGIYAGKEMSTPMRPGSADHESVPSKFGNRLHYRDGRVVYADAVTND